jgi:hypothetical protein
MSQPDLVEVPSEPALKVCRKSYWILNAARQTASELLYLFDNPGGEKRGPGNPSNIDQDLLRSMLIFAGAGLDAAIKQVIKDAFKRLLRRDKSVQAKAIDHFSKHLAKGDTAFKDLARWLFHEQPRSAMASDLIEELTSGSLQSKEQLEKVIDYLKLDRKNVVVAKDAEVKAAFDARNLIIHELDVDFSKSPQQGKRTRTQRQRKDMVSHTNVVFKIAVGFLSEVESKLSTPQS